MALEQTHAVEIAKWDALAELKASPERLAVRDADFAAYARRVSTVAGMAEFLGPLEGRDVLELGCGLGELSTVLARSGARLTALDLSPGSIRVARRRAEQHGVADQIRFVVAPGERLPFPDECFDVAVGKAVLHHLDASLAAPELHRVLRRGGRAAFAEPLATNPLVEFARDHLPYPDKNPRGADRPLSFADLDAWERPFRVAQRRPVQLLTMLERAFGLGRRPRLRRADGWLLARAPWLGRFCRYVVMTMEK